MATVLQLVQGSTTLSLNDVTNYELAVEYTPMVGEADTATETIPILVKGTNTSGLETNRSALLAMLNNANEYTDGKQLVPVYIVFQPDGAAAAWRSPVRTCTHAEEDSVYGAAWQLNLITEIAVILTRENWWEANSETQQSLTNGNGTNNTSGLKVFACADGTGASPNNRCNYVEVAGANVAGNLPAATRIEFTNTYNNGSDVLNHLWVGHSYNITDFANATLLLEGESGSNVSGLLTPAADATASGGNRGALGPIGAGQSTDLYWALATGAATALKGSRFHLLARFSGMWTGWEDTRIMPFVQWSGSASKIVSNMYLEPGTTIIARDLGTVRLPPYLLAQTSIGQLLVNLRFTNNTASAITINLDCLMLMPADSWRYLKAYVPLNSRVMDDGMNDLVYVDNGSGAAKYGVLAKGGAPVMLQPGKTQRIYFMFATNTSPVSPITATGTVKLYYRARRRTI
jgi:hypothetical protein